MLICRVTGWKPFCFHNPLFPAFFAYCLLALFVLIITLFTTFSVTIGDIFIAFPEISCLNENAYFDGVNYVCPDCGREWPCDEIADDDDDNNKLRCPECGSHLVYPDSSGINDYACDACGCRWDGDDDDYDEDYDDDDED